MQKIKPLGANILIKPVEEETTTSGIVLPEAEKEGSPQKGEVIAIGESSDINSEIKVGASVVFRQYSGDKIKTDETEYIILNAEKDVLAVIED